MVIEIIPKEKAKPLRWQDVLFYISLFLLLVSIISYFALDYFIKGADQRLKELEAKLTEIKSPQQIALEEEVLDYKEKIEDFALLFNAHQKSSNFFDFLEKNTHPKVFFSELNLNTRGNRVSLSGRAENFQTLGQQLLIFQNSEYIQNLNLSGVRIGKEGEIKFNFDFSLTPRLFTP